MSGTSGTGVVLASYGRGALVQAGAETLSCALRGRKQRVVCGDRVHWVSGEADGGIGMEHPRSREPSVTQLEQAFPGQALLTPSTQGVPPEPKQPIPE